MYHRGTLELHLKLRGHEGPVNRSVCILHIALWLLIIWHYSIGLLGDRVVSASGDTRMILWDVSVRKEDGKRPSSSGSNVSGSMKRRVIVDVLVSRRRNLLKSFSVAHLRRTREGISLCGVSRAYPYYTFLSFSSTFFPLE